MNDLQEYKAYSSVIKKERLNHENEKLKLNKEITELKILKNNLKRENKKMWEFIVKQSGESMRFVAENNDG